MLGEAKRGVLVWSMGVTQHERGEDNVRAIVNLGLARGFVGREGCGLMPIRGHSGVQGGAEMGCYSTSFPGGEPVNEENAERLAEQLGLRRAGGAGQDRARDAGRGASRRARRPVRVRRRLHAGDARAASTCVEALERIPLRVHMDIVLSEQMFAGARRGGPAAAGDDPLRGPGRGHRDEHRAPRHLQPGDPGAAGRGGAAGVGGARRARRAGAAGAGGEGGASRGRAAIRDEIAEVIPQYAGIAALREQGDSFQFGGPNLPPG